MKTLMVSLLLAVCAATLVAGDVSDPTKVKICTLYGYGYFYVPGTDVCLNARTGDARQQTEGGTWRSLWPYPDGKWVTRFKRDCGTGKVVHIGTWSSTDFTLNDWSRKQTTPVPLHLTQNQFISRIYMSGGFHDPRLVGRSGSPAGDLGLCLKSVDPTTLEHIGDTAYGIIPWGGGGLPIACVSNGRLVNMPASYALSPIVAYPQIDSFFYDAAQDVAGPYLWGSALVMTTDLGMGGETLLQYEDADHNFHPMAGSLSVSVCVQNGVQDFGRTEADQ